MNDNSFLLASFPLLVLVSVQGVLFLFTFTTLTLFKTPYISSFFLVLLQLFNDHQSKVITVTLIVLILILTSLLIHLKL